MIIDHKDHRSLLQIMLLRTGDAGAFSVIIKVLVKPPGLGMSKSMSIGYLFLDIPEQETLPARYKS